jgi:hypothetical protein
VFGEQLARRLLRLDAAYCAGAGLVAIALFGPLGSLLGAPRAVLVVSSLIAIVWSRVLALLARGASWRIATTTVGVLNLGAAVAIGALAVLSAATAARVLLAAVAVEVAAFAAGQFVAVRG